MKSYLASQLIGTIWSVGGIIALVEGGHIKGCFGMIVIGAAYYGYSLYLWGTGRGRSWRGGGPQAYIPPTRGNHIG